MARKRPGLVAARRVFAGVLVFLGVFVFFFGIGNGNQAIMIAGAAIALMSIAFRLVSTLRGSIRQWVVGVGQVTHVSDPPSATPYGRCELQLLIEAPDLPRETVTIREPRVPVHQWPYVGQRLRVEVAADDVRNVRILWPDGPEPEVLPDDDDELWDDQPDPVPAASPPSHLDLDDERGGDDPHADPELDFDLDGPPTWRPPPAQASPADEGRTSRHATVVEEPPQRVPRPRPSPRPGGRPSPHPHREPAGPVVMASQFTTYPSANPGPSGSIHRVGVTMLVRDLAESLRFYRDTLGFHEVERGSDVAVLASGDTRLVLYASRGMKPVTRRVTHLNLDVADIDALYADLRAAGVRFTYGPRKVSEGLRTEQWAAAFRDPDGHGIALTQWRPRS